MGNVLVYVLLFKMYSKFIKKKKLIKFSHKILLNFFSFYFFFYARKAIFIIFIRHLYVHTSKFECVRVFLLQGCLHYTIMFSYILIFNAVFMETRTILISYSSFFSFSKWLNLYYNRPFPSEYTVLRSFVFEYLLWLSHWHKSLIIL